jgi:hypothetical protein
MALDALAVGIQTKKVNDRAGTNGSIRGFFDTLNHDWLVEFIEPGTRLRVRGPSRPASPPEMAVRKKTKGDGNVPRTFIGKMIARDHVSERFPPRLPAAQICARPYLESQSE